MALDIAALQVSCDPHGWIRWEAEDSHPTMEQAVLSVQLGCSCDSTDEYKQLLELHDFDIDIICLHRSLSLDCDVFDTHILRLRKVAVTSQSRTLHLLFLQRPERLMAY